jgi:ComF family protein
MNTLLQTISDVLELFFPRICITCGNRLMTQEKFLCLDCYHDIPRTNFHLDPENKAAQLFWGRVKTENVFSFYYFRKGSKYQKLIHSLKYRGMKELGYEAGKWIGTAISSNNMLNNFDLIVPVPLHPKKEKQRGYNQSEWIARGIADYLGKTEISENLIRLVYSSTQTRKKKFERWKNVEGIFGIKDTAVFNGKHILVVDDVLTTGSTLESCSVELLKIPDVKISLVTLAYAEL